MMISVDGLQFRLITGNSQCSLSLVKEWCGQAVDECIGQFKGVVFLDDDCEDNELYNFVRDSVVIMFNLFEGSVLGFDVGSDLGVMLLDFVSDLEQFLVGIAVV